MKWKQEQRLHSVRRQVRGFTAIPVSILCVLLVLVCIYFGWLLFINCINDYNQELIHSIDDLDELLSELDVYFSYMTAWDDDMYVLAFPKGDEKKAEAAAVNIWQKLRAEVGIDPLISQLFYYKGEIGYRCVYGDAQDRLTQNKVMLSQALKDHCEDADNRDWFVLKSGEQLYLARIFNKGEVYLGGALNLTAYLNSLVNSHSDAGNLSGYGDIAMDGTKQNKQYFLTLPSRYVNSSVFLSARTARVQGTLLHGADMRIWMDIPIINIFGYFPIVAMLCMAASVIILILMPALVQQGLQRILIRPFGRLYDKINRIRARDFGVSEPEQYESDEFRKIDQAFDAMIDEITQLRIAEYENTLLRQKTQLNYYNLQLRPHFFINCLKNVYGLVEQGKTVEVQQFIRELSGYFRYLYTDALEFSVLRNELQYCSYYIRIIRQIRHAAIDCVIDVAEDVLECRIPPFLILTLIENALRHGVSGDASQKITLHISGRITREEGGGSIALCIDNDGRPIPEQYLAILNAMDNDRLYKEGHVGIWNVKKQMQLMYGDKAQMRMSNKDNRVCCDIKLPLVERGVMNESTAG